MRPLLGSAIAVVEIVAGVIIVSDSHIGYATLAVLAGIWLIVNGIGTVAFALAIRMVSSDTRPLAPT